MKHKHSVALSLATIFAITSLFATKVSAQTAGTLSVNTNSFEINPHWAFTVPLKINTSGGDISSFSVTLSFDKSVLSIVNSKDISVNSAFSTANVNLNSSPSTITISGSGAAPGLAGTVTLANIMFTATGDPGKSTVIKLTPNSGTFLDSSNSAFTPTPSELSIAAKIKDVVLPHENLVLQPIETINAAVNSRVTFTAQASDTDEPDDSPLMFSLANAPSGAKINSNTGVFTWTPKSTGTFTFDVVVADGDINTSQPVTIIVTKSVANNNHGHGCGGGYLCKQYREYRIHYKNDEAKEDFWKVHQLKEKDHEEYERLRRIYLTYREWSTEQRSTLSPNILEDFHHYKKYNGYKHYRSFKNRV